MDLGPKIFFSEIDLFDFTSFFGLDFLKFAGLLCKYLGISESTTISKVEYIRVKKTRQCRIEQYLD